MVAAQVHGEWQTGRIIAKGHGGGTTVTPDAAGNMLSDGTNAYCWDAANRLVGTTYPGGAGTEYSYDA